MEKLGSDLVFTISEFLSGEDILCTIPLLCKATKLLSLSLSLRQSISTLDFGDIIARINGRGHVITSLRLHKDHIFPFQSKFSLNDDSHSRILNNIFSSVEELELCGLTSTYPSLHYFPRLTKFSLLHCKEDPIADQLLSEIWKISTLTSLEISECSFNADIAKKYRRGDYGPPAFAQTLRSLNTGHDRAVVVLDMLAPHCRNLQHFQTTRYHDGVMINNLSLTSLHLWSCSSSAFDLGLHDQLIELRLDEPGRFTSLSIHSNLEKISLHRPYAVYCASQFLAQCPALKQAKVSVEHWQDMVEIISVLNPDQCKQLDLKIYPRSSLSLPSLDEVEKCILQKGFRMNEEFLLQAHDAPQQWGRIMDLAPGLQHLKRLCTFDGLDHLFLQQQLLPSCFTSLGALTTVELYSNIDWNQEMLVCIAKNCAALKTLHLHGQKFSGVLELESFSLHKVELRFRTGISGYHLILPNLRHLQLYLCGEGELTLLQGILDGNDPLIQLPLLRVLEVYLSGASTQLGSILCKEGHGSLSELKITGSRGTEMEKFTLQNVPSLHKLILTPPPPHVVLDIPGHCDVFFKVHDYPSAPSTYARKGCCNGASNNFVVQLILKDDRKGWIETVGGASTDDSGNEDEKKKSNDTNSKQTAQENNNTNLNDKKKQTDRKKKKKSQKRKGKK